MNTPSRRHTKTSLLKTMYPAPPCCSTRGHSDRGSEPRRCLWNSDTSKHQLSAGMLCVCQKGLNRYKLTAQANSVLLARPQTAVKFTLSDRNHEQQVCVTMVIQSFLSPVKRAFWAV